jgi:thiol:disulfide interchange protein DsbD
MVRFKEFAGLVLMGTTIFLLSNLTDVYMIPTLIGLLGVGTAVWMLGNLSDLMSSKRRRWTVRFSSTCVFLLAGWIGYGMYTDRVDPDPATMVAWEPFDLEKMATALDDGKTVMIDFTANWCATCHLLERTTLNRKETVAKIKEKGIVAMKADWSVKNDTIKNALTALDRNAIPTLAIFSPNRPKEPIVLYDLWTQKNILDQLDLATSEKPVSETQQASLDSDLQ